MNRYFVKMVLFGLFLSVSMVVQSAGDPLDPEDSRKRFAISTSGSSKFSTDPDLERAILSTSSPSYTPEEKGCLRDCKAWGPPIGGIVMLTIVILFYKLAEAIGDSLEPFPG